MQCIINAYASQLHVWFQCQKHETCKNKGGKNDSNSYRKEKKATAMHYIWA